MKIDYLLTSVFLLTMSSAQAAGDIDGLCKNPDGCQYYQSYNQTFNDIISLLAKEDPTPTATPSTPTLPPINTQLLPEQKKKVKSQQKQAPISWY